MRRFNVQPHTVTLTGLAVLALTLMIPITTPAIARAALARHSSPAATGSLGRPTLATAAVSGETAGSLEAAATKAGETGRKVAISMIGLGFAIASIVLAFKRDFKEAVGVFAVGLVAIVLATPTGVTVLHNTVNSLFGSSS